MEERNPLQAAFLAAMGDIQEVCVQTALCQAQEAPLEERLYDLAGEVIVRVMEVLDGYGRPEIGRLCIVLSGDQRQLEGGPCDRAPRRSLRLSARDEIAHKNRPPPVGGDRFAAKRGRSGAEGRVSDTVHGDMLRCRTGRAEIVAPYRFIQICSAERDAFIPNSSFT